MTSGGEQRGYKGGDTKNWSIDEREEDDWKVGRGDSVKSGGDNALIEVAKRNSHHSEGAWRYAESAREYE